MKKLLLILLCLPLLFSSCVNDSQNNTSKNSLSNAIISFSVTSKNPELTSSSGKDVSLNEMTTINVQSNDNILFKDFNFTLDNKVDGALNFFSKYGYVLATSTTETYGIVSGSVIIPVSGTSLTLMKINQ